MIDRDRVAAAHTLYRQGVGRKAIARQLRINVKTLRAILREGCGDDVREYKQRDDRIVVDEVLLDKLYADCCGYIQRMHEILTEEHGIDIGYSTLTRLVRGKKHAQKHPDRSERHPDIPGDEMQHDTSEHMVRIGGVKQKFISCGIYLRYSKMRYVRFYRRFNRFVMKCFIDEALRHWGYCARRCIIDNTNLAVFSGTGSSAIMNPEAVSFADNYGFVWKAHERGHANRKAGKERNFYTIEENFLPGRTFSSPEDLNRQAVEWATVRFAKRPQSKTKLIPCELFETEKSSLIKLPDFICSPYLPHGRLVDQYGYCSFDGNYYWIPETVASRKVTVLQYASHLRIMDGRREVQQYDIPADGVKNELVVPPGHAPQNRYAPKNRKLGCDREERLLRQTGGEAGAYLDMVKKDGGRQYGAFVRKLYSLYGMLGASLFADALRRANAYGVHDFSAVERIARQILLAATATSPSTTCAALEHEDYRNRPAYRDGRFSDENDFDCRPPGDEGDKQE
jgi:transposase